MPPVLSRRQVLSLSAAALAGAVGLPAGVAQAAQRCTLVAMDGTLGCEVGIPSGYLNPLYAPQASSQWCWAASIAMVFAYAGHPVSQARIVAETFGQIADLPASPGAILAALNRPWVDDLGRGFWVAGDALSANLLSAIQDLGGGLPLIVGTLGHAMVLTAMAYRTHPSNPVVAIDNITVRDPWPGQGLRVLTSQEAFQISFLARIRIA